MNFLQTLRVKSDAPEKNEMRRLEFIWLWVRDDDVLSERRVERAIELAQDFEISTGTILHPVVTFWLGAFSAIKDPDQTRLLFVEALKSEFGRDGKIYHGKVAARVSSSASKTSFAFDATPGWRSALLSALCALEFGRYREYESRG